MNWKISEQSTLSTVLQRRVKLTPSHTAYLEKDASGQWQPVTWQAFSDSVMNLARRLSAVGVEPGDQVAIMMPNSIRWEMIQHAVYQLGGIVIGLDANDPPARMKNIFSLCQPKYLFVEDTMMLGNIPEIARRNFKIVIYNQANGLGSYGCRLFSWNALPQPQEPVPMPSVRQTQIAAIIFTSGTTGRPKALSFQHQQFIKAMASITSIFESLPKQAHVACWLPLANPFQRIVNLCALAADWKTYMVSDPMNILSQVQEISPHLFTAVPRFYEKFYDDIRLKVKNMPAVLQKITRWAMQVEGEYQGVIFTGKEMDIRLKRRHAMANKLILRKIRSLMGPNLRYMVSGSAPAGPRLIKAYQRMGWQILEAYGISENIIPMAINRPGASRPGSVGRPLRGNEIRIAPDKEILVKGQGLAQEAQRKLTNGYLKTGDLGRLDAEGYLYLMGRKGDMFKLSTGRKIIPRYIEQAVEQIDAVAHCVAAGQFRKFVVVLVNVPLDKFKQLVQQHGTAERARNHLRLKIQWVCQHLPGYSRPVDMVITHDTFSPNSGELTANLKPRRNYILKKYAAPIENLYLELGQKPYLTASRKAAQNNLELNTGIHIVGDSNCQIITY